MGISLNTGGRPGGGRRSRSRRHSPMHEINVTPFVDVMLVLLIVFMVAAPLLTSGVPLELPETKGQQLQANKEPLTISVQKDGKVYIQETLVQFDEIAETPLGLRRHAAGFPVLYRSLGHADRQLRLRQSKRRPQRVDVDPTTVGRLPCCRTRSRPQF